MLRLHATIIYCINKKLLLSGMLSSNPGPHFLAHRKRGIYRDKRRDITNLYKVLWFPEEEGLVTG